MKFAQEVCERLPSPSFSQSVINRSCLGNGNGLRSTPWTTLKIKSATLADTRTIYVATPAGYGNARRFPVLVLLDADDHDQFNAAVAHLPQVEAA